MPRNTLHRSKKGVSYIDSPDIIGPKVSGISVCKKIEGTSIKLPPNTQLYTCGDNRLRIAIANCLKTKYDNDSNKLGLIKLPIDLYTFSEVRAKAAEFCGNSVMKQLIEDDCSFKCLLSDLIERVRREQNDEYVGEYSSTNLALKYFNEYIYTNSLIASYRHLINRVCAIISIFSGFRVNLTSKNTESNGYFLFGNKQGKYSDSEYNKLYWFMKQLEVVNKIPGNSLARKLDIDNLCFRDELRS